MASKVPQPFAATCTMVVRPVSRRRPAVAGRELKVASHMRNASAQSEFGIGWVPTQRVPVVFVASSAKDAQSLRELLDARRWLLVNVPDLTAAQAVIEKLSPGLIVCDTDIEGPGSWRDLLARNSAQFGPPFLVSSHAAGETLCSEVQHSGGVGVLARPFSAATLDSIVALLHRDGRRAP